MSLDAIHSYDVSKSCADLISQAYAKTYGLPVGITRFGNVYGGGDLNLSRIVPGTIRSLYCGERPVIRSDGTYTRDYLYVEDVADGYLRLAEALGDERYFGRAFNFSSGARVSVLEIVGRIRSLMECEHLEPDVQNTAEAEIRDQHLNAKRARDELGWQPSFDLDRGLQRTIAWYRSFFAGTATPTNPESSS
jgi:CDP-glucose 4,6-dehydratase